MAPTSVSPSVLVLVLDMRYLTASIRSEQNYKVGPNQMISQVNVSPRSLPPVPYLTHALISYTDPPAKRRSLLWLNVASLSLGSSAHYFIYRRHDKFYILMPVFIGYVKHEEIKMQEVVGKAFQEREAPWPLKWQCNRTAVCSHVLNSLFSSWLKSDRQVYWQK